jgi:protein SCO1
VNPKLLPRIIWAHIIMVALGVGFIYAHVRSQTQKQPDDLPVYKRVPDFHLIDQHGRPVRLRDLEGKIWAADFIFTNCTGPCPVMTANLAALQEQAFANEDVFFVSISTDPERDTPEVLRNYAQQHQAQRQWLFLTGPKHEIHALANTGFMLAVAEQRGAGQPIVHSTKVALVDKAGFIRGFYEGTRHEGVGELLRDVKRLAP